MRRTFLLLTLLSMLLAGCQTVPRTDHVQRLLQHPEFTAASRAAPQFVKDALHTINNLQLELVRQENK